MERFHLKMYERKMVPTFCCSANAAGIKILFNDIDVSFWLRTLTCPGFVNR